MCVRSAGSSTSLYGVVFGPAFAARDPLVKTMGTLGLALILLGLMAWRAPAGDAFVRVLTLPTTNHRYQVAARSSTGHRSSRSSSRIVLTVGTTAFLRFTKLGTAMRALANDREITATLGVPVRRVEAAAWLGSGLVCGAAGLLLADLFTSLDYAALTFLVISSLAAALIGRLRSSWVTLAGGIAVGLVQALLRRIESVTSTGRRRRSCWRSWRCSGSRAAASSRSRGRPNRPLSMASRTGAESGCAPFAARAVERASLIRAAVIVALLAFAALRAAELVGADWITTLTSVADLLGRLARPRDSLRARRHDLARPGRAARSASGPAPGSPTQRALPFPVLLLVAGVDRMRDRGR